MLNWRAWLAIGLTAVGLYLVGRWQGAASVADAAAVHDAETALAVGKSYRLRLDSLRQREHQQVSVAQGWKHRADSLRAQAVRVDTVVTSDSGPVSLWRATADAERESGAQCQLALVTCQERAQTAEARAQALDSLLGNVLKIRECHVWFLKCPSRITTGLVGLGLGVAGGVLLTR